MFFIRSVSPTERKENINIMRDKIESILSEVKTKIDAAVSESKLQSVKSAFVGKQGALSLLMKEMP